MGTELDCDKTARGEGNICPEKRVRETLKIAPPVRSISRVTKQRNGVGGSSTHLEDPSGLQYMEKWGGRN